MSFLSRAAAAATALMLATGAGNAATMFVHDENGLLGTVDTTSGATSVIGNLGVILTDIAFDPTGALFGISFDDLYSIDAATAATTLIGAHGVAGGNGLVFGTDGTLYASGFSTTGLFTLDTTTGASSSLGSTGFFSGGDLAFVGSDLFLATSNDQLVSVDLATPSNSTVVGPFGQTDVYGIATDGSSNLFGVAGTSIFLVDPSTGSTSNEVSFAGGGLSSAFGQSFRTEAGGPGPNPNIPPIPVPASLLLLAGALGGLGLAGRPLRRDVRS